MRCLLVTCALTLGLLVPSPRAAQCSLVTGAISDYQTVEGDSLISVAARFGVEPAALAHDNGLAGNAVLHPGQRLSVDSRHIAPPAADTTRIVVNVAQRMLFVFAAGEPIAAFPAAVGRPDWPTPQGTFTVLVKEIDPV